MLGRMKIEREKQTNEERVRYTDRWDRQTYRQTDKQ